MKIRMLFTQQGSVDGIQVDTYEAGKVYDLPSSLAQVFLEHEWAEEDKAIDKAPETKEVKADGTKADNTASKRAGKSSTGKKPSQGRSK